MQDNRRTSSLELDVLSEMTLSLKFDVQMYLMLVGNSRTKVGVSLFESLEQLG